MVEPATIRNADNVLVINDGELIERGTHDELLEKKGFYYRLYMSQFKGTNGDADFERIKPVEVPVPTPPTGMPGGMGGGRQGMGGGHGRGGGRRKNHRGARATPPVQNDVDTQPDGTSRDFQRN